MPIYVYLGLMSSKHLIKPIRKTGVLRVLFRAYQTPVFVTLTRSKEQKGAQAAYLVTFQRQRPSEFKLSCKTGGIHPMLKKYGRFFLYVTMLLTLVIGAGGVAAAPSTRQVTELTILWAEWDPANYLQEIGNRYEAETGIKVNVIQEPWGSFYDRMAAGWAATGDAYDMVVGDSQWIGQGAEQGHHMELTD